ncbi:helix-turn-helix transcriptional regulator [Mesobacillus sp. S13]|uniref:helix-turn-helix transcriptional regulator n=1 Tax=Mesobacillus sp. S13 TaxID=2880221 RepID=UPI001CF39CA7|nr:helix-turn-helix transcriptional regulator [Mesobacillus sp. S13]
MRCRIEELIKARGLQKSFVAKKLGISVKQLRNYETEHSDISLKKSFILADILGVKVDDLYER